MSVNRTQYLYHVTHSSNWLSIGIQGLLTMYSDDKRKSIWLVSRSRIFWAAKHVCKERGWKESDLIVVRVRVRRGLLRRNRIRGVWYHISDIQPRRIEWIKAFPPVSIAIKTRGLNIRPLKNGRL